MAVMIGTMVIAPVSATHLWTGHDNKSYHPSLVCMIDHEFMHITGIIHYNTVEECDNAAYLSQYIYPGITENDK